MKGSRISKKPEQIKDSGKFADFFLHASAEEKQAVFREAVRKANEEQRQVFVKAGYDTKALQSN